MYKNERFLTITSHILRPYRFYIIILLLISFWIAADYSIYAYLLKWLLDSMYATMHDKNITQLILPALLYLISVYLVTVLFRIWDWIMLRMEPALEADIIKYLMNCLENHSYIFFQEHLTGTLVGKVNDVAKGIPDLIRIILSRFFRVACLVVVALIMLALVVPQVAFIILVWLCFSLMSTVVMAPKIHTLSDLASGARSEVTGYCTDVVSNMLAVKLFNGKLFERIFLNKLVNHWLHADRKSRWALWQAYVLQAVTWAIREAVLIYWILNAFKNNVITPGDVALIFSIIVTISNEVWSLAPEIAQLSEVTGAVTQGLRALLASPPLNACCYTGALTAPAGHIVFKNITFGYHPEIPVFESLSLEIKPGERVGLVGYSGSGKSTLVNLLLRLYSPQAGNIYIDNQDIKTVTAESLRENIAFIPQDPSLFHRSLYDNIRYGNLSASQEQVLQAARYAHADEFIEKLPERYNTLVGDRGIKLSGGQRQRIALARAFLKHAKILIMDEATSALDSVTERLIQESLKKLMQNHTVLIIAHRLSTLLALDRIIVLDKGRVIEQGNHYQLLEKKGLYWKLWNAQVDGFIPHSLNGNKLAQ